MNESDIKTVIPLYIDYYNNHEDGEWTEETTYKRISCRQSMMRCTSVFMENWSSRIVRI